MRNRGVKDEFVIYSYFSQQFLLVSILFSFEFPLYRYHHSPHWSAGHFHMHSALQVRSPVPSHILPVAGQATCYKPYFTCCKPYSTCCKSYSTCSKPYYTCCKSYSACYKPYSTCYKPYSTCS